QNSGDWDIMYMYSTDAGRNWNTNLYLAGTTANDEQYCDLKPYTNPGNQWMNASYISEAAHRTVFRHDVSQSSPTVWSDTLRINTNSAGTGRDVRPLLVYSPGAPGTGAGCVFTGAGLRNLYWNSPWTGVALEEKRSLARAAAFTALPNPMTTAASLRWRGPARSLTVFDASGRVVRSFDRPAGTSVAWDRLDNRGVRVAPGVYIARLVTDAGTTTRQLIVQ
ncbi:MAG: T9SS type A sorting domain-containing protein, partial [bacterium]